MGDALLFTLERWEPVGGWGLGALELLPRSNLTQFGRDCKADHPSLLLQTDG